MFLVLSAMLLIVYNPFSDPFNGDDYEAPSEQLSEEPSEPAEPELAEVGLEQVLAGVKRQAVETDTAPTLDLSQVLPNRNPSTRGSSGGHC